MRIVRTPLVKYIQTERITDELIQVLGRLECEARDGYEDWEECLILVRVTDKIGLAVPKYYVMGGVVVEPAFECRIKEQTIKDAYNRLSDAAKDDACEKLEWLREIEG